ncbi:ABC transporter permease [Xylanimonas sp. McL0601]|uniref:ABC transporter permease n=1 Tax=Xylanimonas sp. McL0601 TaxID=3414739 RepID=UPI003CEC0FF2
MRAIMRKELREMRRKTSIVLTMAIVPLVFLVQPLVAVFGLSASSAPELARAHIMLFMLGIPAIAPAFLASFAVVGEREQGTLEPVLGTPIRREELLLGKAVAALLPSLGVAYGVFAIFVVVVRLFADPLVASAILPWQQIVIQVLFTPPIALLSIWLSMAISARATDVRVAQQLGTLVGLPVVFLAALIANDIIHATAKLAVLAAAVLVMLDVAALRFVSATFNRERLITNTR